MKARIAPILCIFFSAHLFGGDVPLPTEGEKWLKVSSGNLRIYSNASPGQTEKIAAELLRLRAAIATELGVEIREPFPTTVYLFRDQAAFTPYRDAAFLRSSSVVSGAFFGGESRNFILMQADAGSSSNRVVYAGLARYFLRHSLLGLPLSVYEGLADYYSTFRGRGEEVIVGMPIGEYVQRLRSEKILTMEQLKAVDANSLKESYDASAWAVVHYLIGHGKKPTANIDISTNELRAYVGKLSGAPLPSAAHTIAPQPAPRDEVLYALGELLAHGSRAVGDTETFIREAIRLNPDRAAAHARAVEMNKAIAITESDPLQARKFFERAVQLDPDSAAAHAALGETYVLSDDDVSAGIAAFEKSLARAPGQPRAAVHLAQLYARAGRGADARRIFDTSIANTADPEVLRVGREALLIADVKRAEDLLASGKDDEARELMRRILSQTTNPRLKAHLEQALQRQTNIEKQLEVAQAAMAKASAGKYGEAVKMLDELLPQIQDADFKQRVRNLREEFAKLQ